MKKTMNLTLADGTELMCTVEAEYTAGGRTYAALLPTSGPEAETGEVYLYRYEGGQLDDIADDEEYEIALDGFEEYLDDQQFEAYTSGKK